MGIFSVFFSTLAHSEVIQHLRSEPKCTLPPLHALQALNTFIDDIFAFIIKMPMLYRIGCLRDDVIFFIFLYQVNFPSIDH